LPNPYKFKLKEENLFEMLFVFTTDFNVEYRVRFTKANAFFSEECQYCFNIYEISFINVNEKRGFDGRIRDTIARIIEYFIKEEGHSVMYTCESIDQKDYYRSKLFEKWISLFNDRTYQIGFKTIEYEEDNYQLHIGIIANIDEIFFNHYFEHLEIPG
jgi:hypothetical protein